MKKENKKLIWSIVAVALIIVLVGGGTYAYWTWASNNNTAVSFTIGITDPDDPTNPEAKQVGILTIEGGGNITTKTLAPAKCNNTTYAIQRKIKVTAKNMTGTDMVETIQLKVAELKAQQGTLNSTNKANIKWALVRSDATQHAASSWKLTTCPATTAATASETVGAVLASNNFGSISKSSVITLYNKDIATKSTTGDWITTTDYYELYIWIDPSYEGPATVGTTVSDPLQDLTINLVWQGTMTNQIS